jgi:hypothetical protein
MLRLVVLLCLVSACKKKEAEPEPAPMPTTPSTGHSSTKVNEEGSGEPTRSGHASTPTTPAPAPAPGDAGGAAIDAARYGGNGAAAYRDDNGKVRGPGGPIYMGRGPDCTDKIDHCLREGVWFATGNVTRGKLFRATPVFEFENKWWNWREREETDVHVAYKTKVVERADELKVGSPVIWMIQEGSRKWVNSESDALTSSRWEAGVVEWVSGSSFKVAGWEGGIAIETARVITQQKKAP